MMKVELNCDHTFAEGEMSILEKKLMIHILPKADKLEYNLVHRRGSDGIEYEVYEIPNDKMQEVIDALWIFEEQIPKANDIRVCLHHQKTFVMRDCLCIRYADRNMIVNPYFLHSGGMAVDLMPIDFTESEMRKIRNFASLTKEEN